MIVKNITINMTLLVLKVSQKLKLVY